MTKFGDGVFKNWDTNRMVTTWTVVVDGTRVGECNSKEAADKLYAKEQKQKQTLLVVVAPTHEGADGYLQSIGRSRKDRPKLVRVYTTVDEAQSLFGFLPVERTLIRLEDTPTAVVREVASRLNVDVPEETSF